MSFFNYIRNETRTLINPNILWSIFFFLVCFYNIGSLKDYYIAVGLNLSGQFEFPKKTFFYRFLNYNRISDVDDNFIFIRFFDAEVSLYFLILMDKISFKEISSICKGRHSKCMPQVLKEIETNQPWCLAIMNWLFI